jgi:hypothetical protein
MGPGAFSITGPGLLPAAPMLGLLLTLVRWGQASDRSGERPVMVLALAGARPPSRSPTWSAGR